MKARARNLSVQTAELVFRILDAWKGPLTWSALISAIDRKTRQRYTRQALHRHESILNAFQERKRHLKLNNGCSGNLARQDPTLQIAQQRIDRLEAENARLKAEANRLLERFARWSYNAYASGVSEEELNRELPPVARGQTDRSARSRGR